MTVIKCARLELFFSYRNQINLETKMLIRNLLWGVLMSWQRRVLALALVSFSFFGTTASAEESQTLVRADGAQVPLRVFAVPANSCQGIAVISPGAGGTEKGLSYIAKALSRDGWLSVVVGHRESGPSVLRGDMQGTDLKGALLKMTTDRSAYEARWMDIGAALDWAHPRCDKHFSALIGHSMGAATAMLEAGAGNKLNLTGQDRFDAYVAMSPQGPGSVFPDGAWSKIRKPVLMLTGTRDNALEGAWTTRTVPYDDMPAGCKWLGVIDGATHMNFAGNGFSRNTETLAIHATQVFLNSLAAGSCGSLADEGGIVFKHK
jgi:dienelactone hydrolase